MVAPDPDGLGADLIGGEAECVLAARKLAGQAELIAEKLLEDGTMAAVHVDGTHWSGGGGCSWGP